MLRVAVIALSVFAFGCRDDAAPADQPVDGGADGSGDVFMPTGEPCASDRGGPQCLGNCERDEVCFTQIACGSTGACFMRAQGRGDDRCHKLCEVDSQCGPRQRCFRESFYGCGDFNGPRGLCLGGP